MEAKASYLIFCDPAPIGLGSQTDVELLLINSVPSDARSFRLADKPYAFLNKQGVDISPINTDSIDVAADLTLEGNTRRSFRIYLCINGVPCVGEGNDPLQATVVGGRALLRGAVRLGDQNRDCSDYLDAMLKQEEDRLDAPAVGPMAASPATSSPQNKPAGSAASTQKTSAKARTAAIIKNLLNS